MMWLGYLLVILYVTCISIPLSTAQTCTYLPGLNLTTVTVGSVCNPIIDYQVYVPAGSCLSATEQQLTPLPTLWSLFTGECRRAVAVFLCTASFRRCSAPAIGTPCRDIVTDIDTSCGATTAYIISGLLPEPYLSLYKARAMLPNDTAVCNPGPSSPHTVIPRAPLVATYTGKVCAGTVDYPVYVPFGYSIGLLEAQVATKQFLFALAPRGACQQSMMKYICGQVFLPADSNNVAGFTLSLPKMPCQNLCTEFATNCAPLIYVNAALKPNCTSKGTRAPGRSVSCTGQVLTWGQNDWPSTSEITVFQAATNSSLGPLPARYTTCNTFSSATANGTRDLAVNYICPAPLVVPTDPTSPTINGGACAVPCPSLLFTNDEYTQADGLFRTLAFFSWICCIFLFLTWTVFKKKRQQRFIVYFTGCLLWISTMVFIQSFILPAAAGNKHVIQNTCKNNVDILGTPDWRESADGFFCVVIGGSEMIATLAAGLWWFIQAFDLFLMIVADFRPAAASKNFKIKEYSYHALAWGLPMLLTFLAAGNEILGGVDGGGSWCALHGRNPNHTRAQWALFYYPMLTVIIVSSAAILAVMISLARSASRTGRGSNWRQYMRSLLFWFMFFAIFLFIYLYRVYAEVEENNWRNSATAWVQCLLIDNPSTGRVCNSGKPTDTPIVGLWLLIHVSISGQGVFNFVIYGTMLDNYQLWAELIGAKTGWVWCIKFGKRRPGSGNQYDGSQGGGTKDGSRGGGGGGSRGGRSKSVKDLQAGSTGGGGKPKTSVAIEMGSVPKETVIATAPSSIADRDHATNDHSTDEKRKPSVERDLTPPGGNGTGAVILDDTVPSPPQSPEVNGHVSATTTVDTTYQSLENEPPLSPVERGVGLAGEDIGHGNGAPALNSASPLAPDVPSDE